MTNTAETTHKPILFSAPMVKALLAGRKSQTRRIVKDAMDGFHLDRVGPTGWQWTGEGGQPRIPLRLPYAVGNRLYVVETWRTVASLDAESPSKIAALCLDAGFRKPWAPVQYEADGQRANWIDDKGTGPGRLRASIHMPRWASRWTLTVTDVRVQRLQDISEADALAEGVQPSASGRFEVGRDEEGPILARSPATAFAWVWNSIHGDGAWGANPCVAAYTFTVEQRNIDV